MTATHGGAVELARKDYPHASQRSVRCSIGLTFLRKHTHSQLLFEPLALDTLGAPSQQAVYIIKQCDKNDKLCEGEYTHLRRDLHPVES